MRLFVLSVLLVAALAWNEHDDARQVEIDRVNNNPKNMWTAGHNPRFAGLPIGASKSLCGAHPTSPEELELMVQSGVAVHGPKTNTTAIPDSFDSGSASKWSMCADIINEIRDQSNCGCCWAFGAAEAASDRMCIATKGSIAVPLSSQDMCFCGSYAGCNGGQLYSAWSWMKSNGLVTGGQFNNTSAVGGGWCSAFSLPHCHHHGPQGNDPYPAEGKPGCPHVNRSPSCPRRCDKGAKSPHSTFSSDKYSFSGRVQIHSNNADAIAQSIMDYGPVEAAFTVYSDFENYSGGIYHHTGGSELGGHAIRIVGWGEENGVPFWKVANSWNPYWGENGYFRIVRGKNECGIEGDVVSSSSSAKWAKMSDLKAEENLDLEN